MGKGNRANLPANWPDSFPYLASPIYSSKLAKGQLQAIRIRPTDDSEIVDLPPDIKPGPCLAVKITPITDSAHPACGQSGLFAARDLKPGEFIVIYLGEVHSGSSPKSADQTTHEGSDQHAKSDYDLWLDRDADVAVDASRAGNEARFVNDYRGVPGKEKPNAEFRTVWDNKRGEKLMAVFVLPLGKKAALKATGKAAKAGCIAKGEEILVSYGKGFWDKRKEEASDADLDEC